jgi:prepilin-type N-terminal cleavage/methylation domain-containing protein
MMKKLTHNPLAGQAPSLRARAGFSLLELLVALTILAIALIPVAYFYTKSLQAVEEAGIRTRALTLAQERITEIQQMPYSEIRSNISLSPEQRAVYTDNGDIDLTTQDWTGNDFAIAGRISLRGPEAAGMFMYPLPLDFNPYQPQTQGYNNATGVNHYRPNNPIGTVADGHINFNDGSGNFLDYEYEPIGFYQEKVLGRNRNLAPADRADIAMADRRSIPALEPALQLDGTGTVQDVFRFGSQEEADKYAIYGRRTIIIDTVPTFTIQDTDGDVYAADDDRDGNATALDPYPLGKGPDNKFQKVSRYGLGKEVTVIVFWLPRNAPGGYIESEDLNKIELKTFIPDPQASVNGQPLQGSGVNRNDNLFITTD